MAKGNYTNAYATKTPVRNNMADFAIQQEQLDSRRKSEDREVERFNLQKEKYAQDKIDKLASYTDSVKGIETGYANFDAAVADAATQVSDKIYELSKVYNDNSKSEQERVRAKSQMNHLENNFTGQMKNLSKSYTDLYTQYTEGKAKGDIHENEEFENYTRNGLKGLSLKLNADNKFDLYAVDSDGDGVLDVTSVEDFMALRMEDVIQPKIDIDKQILAISKTIEPEVNQIFDPKNPYFEDKSTEISQDKLDAYVDSILTPQAMNSWRIQNGISVEDFTSDVEEDLRLDVSNKLKSQVKGLGRIQKYDISAKNANENADASRAQSASQFAITEDRLSKNGRLGAGEIEVTRETLENVENYDIPIGSRAFTIPNGQIEIGSYRINAGYVPKGSKELIFTGEKGTLKKGKGSENDEWVFAPVQISSLKNAEIVNSIIGAGYEGIKTHGDIIKTVNNKPFKQEESSTTNNKPAIQFDAEGNIIQ